MLLSSLFSWTKSISTSTIFIGIFGLIFSIFLFSNTSVILSKFGFETSTELKGKLTKAHEQLKAAKLENDSYKLEVERLKKLTAENNKAISEANKETNKTVAVVDKVQKDRATKKKDATKVVDDKTVVTDTEIIIPAQEYNELSAANIDSINSTYDQLFADSQTQVPVNDSSATQSDSLELAMA